MRVIDLTREFAEIVQEARGTIEFKARFWSWLEAQRRDGPLAPLLSDMERHWSTVGEAPSLSEARDVIRQLGAGDAARRAEEIAGRFKAVTGHDPDVDVVLLAGLERPEGYSRFDRGRNTIFLGLDHPTARAHVDHLELILAHELCHAVRDPCPDVLADYGGAVGMTHDDFVARHPFREHLVSESLATSVSETAFPGRPDRRYVYFDEEDVAWCEEHRREIAERMLKALENAEPYRTFYAEGSVTPDSPDCCDYWFGLHLGRFAQRDAAPGELLTTPSSAFLGRFLEPFVDDFLAVGGRPAAVLPAAPAASPPKIAPDESLAGASLPRASRRFYDEYAERVARRPGLARRLDEAMIEALESKNLGYADESWDVHAFPLVMTTDELRHLRWATDGLARLVDRLVDLYREDREVRAFFRFPRAVEQLCLLEPGFRPHVMLGRFDSFWSGRRLRFIELNVNGTAGWTLAETLAETALSLPGLDDLLERHGAEASPLTSRIFDGLLDAWRQARGAGREPRRIAIVDWPGVATASEQSRLARDFTAMGVPTSIVAPSALSFDGRSLSCPEGPVDVVYRRLTTLDLIDRADELETLLAAARADAMVTVSSFASDVAHSKRMFAFLTHERWQRRLSPAERAIIEAHVPWTRMFWPGRTQYEGRRWDLRELALAARERFVLKPAESYEGRGVLLGAETPEGVWKAEVERRFGGDHVLQERVQPPARRLIVPRGDAVEEVHRWLHVGEFVIRGQLAGCLARASQELVLSVESNERSLPCLVLGGAADDDADQDLGPAAP